VLLNIWATWCVPCRKEMPTLDRLQSKLGGKDFEVVALSIDRRGRELVEPFYKELGLHALAIYLDQPGAAPRAFNTVGVPTTLLIDRDGREIASKVGPAEWDSDEMIAVIRDALDRPQTEPSR
jgi:thiol-disulfide isomerase/thioredoxin